MNCLHPRRKTIIDAITGEKRVITFPCGHCINCLHDFQESWSIRLGETAKYYKQYIYDTLTARPSAVRVKADFTRPTKDGCFYGTTTKFDRVRLKSMMKGFATFNKLYPRYSKEVWEMLKKTNFKVYEFDKAEIQDWLKRGRENYRRDHSDTRIDITYFIVEEYGPHTSRPHMHLLMFGINYLDYQKYFGHPWNYDYGFTRPVYHRYTPWEKKDLSCISKYIAKYITKGDFENVFVKEGLQSKPFRLISKGIGQGLLLKDCYNVFKSPSMVQYKDYYKPSEETFQRTLKLMTETGVPEEKIHKYIEDYQYKCKNVEIGLAFYHCPEIDNLTEEEIQCLYCYYDEGGYPHKLPQYYKQKLFGGTNNEKNILQSKIQDVLQQSARLHDNKVIQREALDLGIVIPDEWCESDRSTWKLSPSQAFMVDYNHLLQQTRKASALAERRELRLKNFYNRPKYKTEGLATT